MKETADHKWNWEPMPSNVPSRSGEDSTFDHFRSNLSRFIIREYIQNSMDASVDSTGSIPVEVDIYSGSLNINDYPEFNTSLKI